MWTKLLKIVLPVVIVALGFTATRILVSSKQPVRSETPPQPVRVVRVQAIERGPLIHEVRAFGTVAPRAETTLVAEVTGRIVETHPTFVDGGSVRKQQLLLEVDPSTYEANVATARAELARAGAVLTREQAESKLAAGEWKQYGKGTPSPLVLREPQLAEASALVDSAKARLSRVELDLERTKILAPYDGRIRERFVEEGQYVTAGTPVASIYATDYAEVVLPISPDEVGYLNLPLGGEVNDSPDAPTVALLCTIGGRTYRWPAWITRTGAEVDARTRSIAAVARVKNPYAPPEGANAPPLLVGTFVEAIISGQEVTGAAVIPRHAVTDGKIWIVDPESRLRRRTVSVLRLGQETAWIGDGVEDGEHLCVSELDLAVEGMKVRVADAPRAEPPVKGGG